MSLIITADEAHAYHAAMQFMLARAQIISAKALALKQRDPRCTGDIKYLEDQANYAYQMAYHHLLKLKPNTLAKEDLLVGLPQSDLDPYVIAAEMTRLPSV